MSWKASGQHIRYIEDTLHYCITEEFTKFLVKEHRRNLLHIEQITNLKAQALSDSVQISILEQQLDISDTITSEMDSLIELGNQELELTEKELRRQNRRARWQKVWQYIKFPLITAASGAAGYGIGRIPH